MPTLQAKCERISSELMSSGLEQVYVRSPEGYVLLNAVGKQALLLVLTSKSAKLGLIFLDIQRVIKDLEGML